MTTPPPVARYRCFTEEDERGFAYGSMQEHIHGDYVLADSYDRLAAECERLRRANKEFHGLLADALSVIRLRVPYTKSGGWSDVRRLIEQMDAALTPTSKEPQQ